MDDKNKRSGDGPGSDRIQRHRPHTSSLAGAASPSSLEYQLDPNIPITKVRRLKRTARPTYGSTREYVLGSIICRRFRLEEVLGRGGMGAVYSATDLEKQKIGQPDSHIAIKLLSGDFQDHPHALTTFQREAKKTQELAHPHIVRVFDVASEDGIVYLTMERLRGASLIDVIQGKTQHDLNFNDKVDIIRQVADALAYAHQQGTVHSDLKPANLFLTDTQGIKVLDFGIARAVNNEFFYDGFDASQLGALTLSYASPEMIRFEPPHPSDDIYALGIIICELFGDHHPFYGVDAISAIENNTPPKIPDMPSHCWQKLVLDCLTPKRNDRIADAGELLIALNRCEV